jgi:SOS-response transcriptional repressor LexA
MPTDHRAKLATIKRFDQLIAYLRDEMAWPIENGSSFEDLTFEYLPDELGIDAKTAAKIQEIKRLRPLSPKQPWGIFFVKFEPKRLPVVALRRILGQVALKKRASANSAERAAWAADDLLFVSNYGEGNERQISFAHFAQARDGHDLPTLKVLGWDNSDTALHLDAVARELSQHLAWPDDDANADAWRKQWRAAFTLEHREVITTARELSIRLAELARAIRDRIQTALAIETSKGPLTQLMDTFRSALVHDLDPAGFADMYAQTIAYGLLSARIADPSKKSADDLATHMRTSPFLRELMETFLRVGGRKGKAGGLGLNFDELGVSEVIELLDAANMEAVVRDFGDRNRQEDPVMHFFEGFLQAYNKAIKKDRGVFYTPQPVVSYIVRSVHELLQTEFGLADGLADTATWGEMLKKHPALKLPPLTDSPQETRTISPDEPFVQVLDPATGTATFLVEVIDVIHRTLAAKWKQQRLTDTQQRDAWNDYVPKHLLPRLHAFELMMAPYAIAHMKIGLKLVETGYRFGTEERARIYLTNALEPWVKQLPLIGFDALAHEAAAVNEIKRHKRFTVVIGNPPYSGVSSNMSEHAQHLVDAYKIVDGAALNERKLWLQDDYVKFIRNAQITIDCTTVGVLGYITNHGYLDNPTFRGMRQSLIGTFSSIRALDLHGNTTRTEYPPEGVADKNVFDIQQGVAVCLATRGGSAGGVEHADLWGTREMKYSWLAAHSVANSGFASLTPDSPYYFFEPQNNDCRAEYDSGWKINEAMPLNCAGFITARDHFVVDLDKGALLERIGDFANLKKSDADIRATYFAGCGSDRYPDGDTRGWKVPEARRRVAGDKGWRERVRVCSYRPFDKRPVYWADWMVDWPRPQVSGHMLAGSNIALHICRQSVSEAWAHVLVARGLIDDCYVSNKSRERGYAHPLYLYELDGGLGFDSHGEPNFAPAFLRQLASALNLPQAKPQDLARGLVPEDIFHYAYAVFHSPGYRSRYAEFLKIDFPRLPLPRTSELFQALARLGGELTALHLLESPQLDQPVTEFIGNRNAEVEKVSWARDTVWVDKSRSAGFRGVSEDVWKFYIGGYQVCEKWLKDRKGRTLSKDDIAHYQKIVVALAETIRLMKEIDEVIEQHGGWPGAFQAGGAEAAPATVIPFRPRTVEPTPAERYVTCVPLVPLKAAAGAFSDPQHIRQAGWDDDFEWIAVDTRHRLRKGMFVAQVVGKSMEPAIPDGAYCLFRAPVEGTRQGKTVLVQLRDASDPETGQCYTVKRYESEKAAQGDTWGHACIVLKPLNPDFQPMVLTGKDGGELQVIAEVVEVLAVGDQNVPEAPKPWLNTGSSAQPQVQQLDIASLPSDILSARSKRSGDNDEAVQPDEPLDLDEEDLPCQIRSLFSDNQPRDRESAIRELREQLGFKRTGHVLRASLDNGLRTAVRRGILESQGGVLKLHLASIDDFERSFLKEQFLASLAGRAWRERAEAARGLARFLGFRRTGPAIEDAVRSIINGLLREGRLEARAAEIRRID